MSQNPPRGIERGSGTEDTVGREAAQFPGDISHDIDGVGDDNQDGVRAVLSHLRDNVLEDVHVALAEVQTGFADVLASSGGDNNNRGAG